MALDEGLRTELEKSGVGRSPLPPLGLLTATLSDGDCNGSLSSSSSTVSASYGSTSVGVRVGRSPLRTSVAALSAGQVIAHSSSIVVRRAPNGLSVAPAIGEVQVDLPDWSPPVCLRLVTSLSSAFLPFSKQWNAYQNLTFRRRVQFYDDLLHACCGAPATADPLSRTQLSFMVNSGKPQALRADPSLAIITRMRSAARRPVQPHAREPDALDSGWEEIMENSVHASLVQISEQALIDLHPDDIPESFIYQQLFTSEERGAPGFAPFPLLLYVSSRRITISLGSHASTRNQLELGPGHLRLQIAEREFAKAEPLSANKSSTSLLPNPEHPTLHVILTGSLAWFRMTLHPSFLSVIEGVLRLQREMAQSQPAGPVLNKPAPPSPHLTSRVILVETFLDIEQFEARALAQVLSVGMRVKGGHLACSVILGPGFLHTSRSSKPVSLSVLAGYREFSVQARSTQDEVDGSAPDRPVLAALTLLDAELFTATDLEDLRGTLSLNSMKLTVPRSALKLYTFVKQWKAEYLPYVGFLGVPNSYPIMLCPHRSFNAMFKRMLSEIDEPVLKTQAPSRSLSLRSIDFQAQFNLMSVNLHVMHGQWLSWSLEDTLAYMTSTDLKTVSYGVQLAAQRITLSGEPDETGSLGSTPRPIKFALPSLRLSGVFQGKLVEVSLIIDHFRLMLKPQYMDDILVVQQKFGSDFNELVDVFASNKKTTKPKAPQGKRSAIDIAINAAVKLEGFTIGIQGPTSTQYLRSPQLSASYRTGLVSADFWNLNVKELELSLVHDVQPLTSRRHREEYNSASMSLDCLIHNAAPQDSAEDVEYLTISIPRVQAIMAPAAISELGNLIDHIQVRGYPLVN